MPAALLDDAKTDSAPPSLVHIAYDKLFRAEARWVFTSSPALPSGDDESPTTRDQDAADDVRVMREAYSHQWVVDSLKKSKSRNPASSSALMAEVF